MKKINVLSSSIYNRIAAGEVVDKPYSVVKELVENSIDAGATEIEIHIERGGKDLIKVIDNGSGIDREDLHDAFLPHATSKISNADDLEFITTLGFRGEALASISSVAKVEIISVTEGNQAYKIACDGGEIGEILPAALECGTVICVRNLFFNTPARAKFMRADNKEESEITNLVSRYILCCSDISFKYFSYGKLCLQSFGGGLEEAVAQVYGAKVLSECYKIDAVKDGFHIYGYIGNQNFFKSNKTYQSLFLNGRFISSNTVSNAINVAYSSYAMKRQYPFYVMNLEVPYGFVDVNVHPNKTEVRFMDDKRVFSAVYGVVSAILDGTAKAAEFVVNDNNSRETKQTFVAESVVTAETELKSKNELSFADLIKAIPSVEQESFTQINENRVAVNEEFFETELKNEEKSKSFEITNDVRLSDYIGSDKVNYLTVTDDSRLPSVENYESYLYAKNKKQQEIDFKNSKFKGNLFNTYLIYELDECVYLIDQHAAHERLIYDELIRKFKERTVVKQPMLVPYIFNANHAESQFLDENAKVLRSMGFGLSPFGMGSYRVDEVPVDLQEIDIKAFFDEVLSQIDGLKTVSVQEVMKEKLAMTACKHAIKGGMQLTDKEVDRLFEMIDGNTGLKCPHGRPVCVKLTKKEIEKMFKRIV